MRRWILILIGFLPLLVAPAAISQAPRPAPGEFDDLLHQAFDLHQRNDYAQALPLLHRARKLQPHDYFVNLLLGIDLLRTGKGADARGFLREAARARPKEEFPLEYLGEAEAGLKHYDAAAEAYAQAIQVAPQSPQASIAYVDFSLARFGEMAGRLRGSRSGLAAEYRLQALAHPLADSERLQFLQRSVELDGTARGIWGEMALAQAAAGKQTEAEQSLDKSRQHTDDVRAWEAEALLAAQKGDWKAAAQRLNDIARRSAAALAKTLPDWPGTLLPPPDTRLPGAAAAFLDCVSSRCAVEELRVKIAVAVRLMDQGRERVSSKSRLTQAGIALAELNDCDHAIPALERGLNQLSQTRAQDSDGSRIYSMFLLSWCYAQHASAVAERLQQTGEYEAQIHVMRGDVLLRLEANSAGAVSEYRAALAKRGNDPEILQRLAEAQLGAGQTAEATASAQQALTLDPHRVPAMRTLAKIEMEKRDYTGALQYLRLLAAADPADLSTRVQLGTACAQTGALDEALQNLSPALQKGYPDEKGSLHYLLGTVLRKLGRTSEANAAFATARELSDNFQRTSHRDETQADNQP